MQRNNQTKKKGFSLLSFLLGLLLGIIILAGALAGGIYYVLNADIDNVLGMAGLDNSKDENGRNKYINTDEAGNLMELFSKVSALTSMGGDMTLGDFDNLVPATTGMVQGVLDGFSSYVELDVEELKGVKFSEFNGYIEGVVQDIEISNVVTIEGGNPIVEALINGVEADTVTVDGKIYPVYADEYYPTSNGYRRKDEEGNFAGETLPTELEVYLYKKSENEDKPYYLYYYKSADGRKYVLSREDIDENEPTKQVSSPSLAAAQYNRGDGVIYTAYNEELSKCTGNFYTDERGERVTEVPVRLGDYMGENNGYGPMEKLELLDLLGESANDDIIKDILGGVTVEEMVDGEVDFSAKIDDMNLSRFIDVYADDSVTVYIGYGITNLAYDEARHMWVGRYIPEGEEVSVECYATVNSDNIVESAYYLDNDGNEVQIATKIGGINAVIDGIGVDIFLDVDIEKPMFVYLGYGLTEVTENDGAWTGTYIVRDPAGEIEKTYTCTIEVDANNIVTSVYYTNEAGDTVYVRSTGLDEISDRVDNLTKDLKLKEVMDIDPDDKMMVKLGESKIDDVGEAIDDLELADVIDNIEYDNSIMAYIAYGVTNIGELQSDNGNWYVTATYKNRTSGESVDEDVYLKLVPIVPNGDKYRIDYMYTSDGGDEVRIEGTHIDGVSDRVDGVMQDLKLGELIDVDDEDNTILNALKDTVIDELGEKIDSLTVNELFYKDVYGAGAKLKKAVSVSPSDGEKEIVFNSQYLYYTLDENGKYVLYNSGAMDAEPGHLDSLAGQEVYTYGAAQPLWKLLVYSGSGTLANKSEKAFLVNKIGDMINNVTENIENATIKELVEAGILTIEDYSLIESKTLKEVVNMALSQNS